MGTGSEYYVNDVALALPSYDDQSSNPRYRLVSPAQVPLLVVGVSPVSRVSIALQPYRIRIQTLGKSHN